MKKLLTVSLALAILTSPILSCADNANSNEQATTSGGNSGSTQSADSTSETDSVVKDSLPDNLDFGGAVINMHVRNDVDSAYEFLAEGENADIVNDIIYRRNELVQERLNVKLNVILGEDWTNYTQALSTIRNSINAGDNSYQLIAGWSTFIPTLAVEGYLADLLKLPHLNLSERWWNKSITDELTIDGKLNFAVGDANLSALASAQVIFANKNVQQDYAIPDLYQVVFDGGWTFDYMSELLRSVYKDINGNGKSDAEDLFGSAFNPWGTVDAFMQSSDIRMTKKDEEGMPYLDIEYERLSALIDKVYNLLFQNEGVYYDGDNSKAGEMFVNDQLLLKSSILIEATTDYREMETDFGILPYPKFDRAQEKYYTRIQDGLSLLCVPMNCDMPEAVGAFMEATASESYKSVTSVFFDTAMKVKYARDETSSKMLDIIREGEYVNFASVYNNSIGSPWWVMRDLMYAKSNDFASWYDKNSPKIEAGIEKVVNKIKEID
ncbi:hypothetical protein FACS1894105_12780 [Clostridia bacterium]|nr:hypothetical protein FACS1894105_12780 [Clostridia bacterium]